MIKFKKIDIKNFKNTAAMAVEVRPGGFIVKGRNESGKSSILEAITFALGGNVEASKVINTQIKAPATVSLTIEHGESISTYSRTLTPTLDADGKITASSSTYVIDGVPLKANGYANRVSELFNTKDWMYLLNPALSTTLKDARAILLEVAGAPEERHFLSEKNQALSEIIGNESFADFEKKEKQIIDNLGRQISAIPGRIEELSAMLQEIPELEDEAPIHTRIAEIREVLKGVDQANAERADQYNKVSAQAQELRNEAQKLRNKAADLVAEANKVANKQVEEAESKKFDWERNLAGLRRQADRIKAEMSEVRQDQSAKERQLAESVANIQTLADQCREISARVPSANGNCTLCGKWCAELQAKGIEASISANAQELDRTKQKGRAEVARRDKLQAEIEAVAKKIDGLQSMENEVQASLIDLDEIPTVPLRKVVESTEESRKLEMQADELAAKADKLIQANRLEVAQKPTELVEELQQLNNKLLQQKGTATTQAQNDKIEQRINELQAEESNLITTQLQHKQYIVQLKEFYKMYADSVTASVNKLFDGTGFEIRLFESNMSNEKGIPVMQPMKDGSTNLSTATALIFGIRFIERVLSNKFGLKAPIIVDNAECIDDFAKLAEPNETPHQIIAASVADCDLTFFNYAPEK